MKPDQKAWFDANLVAALLVVNPKGLKGIAIKSQYGPARDAWLRFFKYLISLQDAKLFKTPPNIAVDQLVGGLDIEASLQQRSLILSKGLLERARGNYLLLSMAERMDSQALVLISQELDEFNTVNSDHYLGVIAFDESVNPDEAIPTRVSDRLAFEIYLDQLSLADIQDCLEISLEDISAAKKRLPTVKCSNEYLEIMIKAGLNLGVISLRANQFALETAKTLAALRGLNEVGQDELIDACRLVYTPSKRMQIPPEIDQENHDEQNPENDQTNDKEGDEPDDLMDDPDQSQQQDAELEDIIVEAVKAMIPPQLLMHSGKIMHTAVSKANRSGKSGATYKNFLSGRPLYSRKGSPQDGRRLDILKSIRSAIPWQGVRSKVSSSERVQLKQTQIDFRSEDLHIKQYLRKKGTVTIFLVDTSGSSATQRLAEAKGALEELLSQCYIRRDEVAMISMRGTKAEIVLPPTRSLVRAKRNLAALPGGGGTPLAAGLRAANELALSLERKGFTVVIVIMSDGKANVDLNGVGGRASAHSDALTVARGLSVKNYRLLFVDTSPKPEPLAQELSSVMAAHYFPLPISQAGKKISHTVIELAKH